MFFSGPIASALGNKYGIRAVVIAGSIIASIAFFLSTFAPNLDVLIFTYGVVGGQYFYHKFIHVLKNLEYSSFNQGFTWDQGTINVLFEPA